MASYFLLKRDYQFHRKQPMELDWVAHLNS